MSDVLADSRISAEVEKLLAEKRKLLAEEYKLIAEGDKYKRERALHPFVLFASGMAASAAFVGAAVAIIKYVFP